MPDSSSSMHRSSRRGRHDAARVLFPAAAAYAAVAVPAGLAGMRHSAWRVPGLSTPAGHAHEMLFGFALAVVAGFLVRRTGGARVGALGGLWLLARITWLAAPGSLLAAGTNGAFAALVAALAAPGLLRGAKKLRNRAFPLALIALCVAEGGFQYAAVIHDPLLQRRVAVETVLLLAVMMAFMGGRIIAPAAAGHVQRRGAVLRARVQPRVEALLLLALAAALATLPLPGLSPVAGALLALAGTVAAVRLARWRPWLWAERRDLLALATGYAWLAAGLVATGVAVALDAAGVELIALHLITVGALGTLTLSVMGRSRLQRAKRSPPWTPALSEAVLLLALATGARVAGGLRPGLPAHLVWTAALLWLAAFALLVRELLRHP
ncbi:MAG TPA: NnrS family protein [Gammaproteobacteria bacterium]|nr:NnrS family protein [Gammaproteobacteria bacterium]